MVQQQIQQCAQQCSNLANDVRGMANQAPDQRAREMLSAAAVHLEMCVHSCNDAFQQAQQAQQASGQVQFQRQY